MNNNENNLPIEDAGMHISRSTQDESYSVVLPCDPKQFGGFIAGLLGKPQEKTGTIEGSFQINQKEISNICHLVIQRVKRQNESTLIQLAITVHYDDGDSVSHHNINDFENYHPTTDCKPVGISIDFRYLIKFQGKDFAEKQEINVSIETQMEFGHHRVKRWFRSGLFMYRILHTERTWASDISGLLKGHAESIIKKPSAIVNFIANHDTELINYFSLVVFLVFLYYWVNHTLVQVDQMGNLTSYWVKSFASFSLIITILIAINQFFQYHISLRRSSLLVLTEKDIKNQTKSNTNYFWACSIYALGWVSNVLAGVFSTYLYTNM